jgi:selenide,water dikinase
LAQVLRHLKEGQAARADPNLLLGLESPDDAGVYRLTPDLALVQTVDFFTPIVDDPYAWGAIAAANSMSDVYAMGARPLLALNLVGWPRELGADLLARVIQGGADKAAEGGLLVIGGHTIDDPEPKYGMAVTGTVRPERVVRTTGARPGMQLVLTKPLSMGVISTALKHGAASPALIEQATAIMATLNKSAAEAMVEVGVGAATDVTGFGLIGHLHDMLRGEPGSTGVGVEIWADQVPVLDGVADLIAEGFVPGGTRSNEAAFSSSVDFHADVDAAMRTVLFDAQTSGGLLIAVEEERGADLVRALEAGGAPERAVIGRFTDTRPGRIKVTSCTTLTP